MATPTRLANKTIDSLELAADVLTGIVTDFGSVSDFFAQDLAEAKFNMDKKRPGRIAAASTAADGGMVNVTAGKNEEDGDHRHHSIDRGIHGYLLFYVFVRSQK